MKASTPTRATPRALTAEGGVWLQRLRQLPYLCPKQRVTLGLVDAKPSIAHDDDSDPTDDCKRAEELATLLQTTSCCSYHLQLKQRNPVERGWVDVSFSSGHKVGLRWKRCSPEGEARCVVAGRLTPRDI